MQEQLIPHHYHSQGLPECKELIKAMLANYSGLLSEYQLFCLGNVIKYIYRAPFKNKQLDLQKAKIYLDWILDEQDTRE